MAEAIARAAMSRSVLRADQMVCWDPSPARQQLFAGLGIGVLPDNGRVIEQVEQVLIAVKPQMMEQVAGDLAGRLREDQVVISIMAGISSAKLAGAIGRPARIVRVMPNTPLMVGQGMTAYALGVGARAGDEALTSRLFGAAGRVVAVNEELMDGVTAVSGSGPAYVFYLAEAMERAAGELGLGAFGRELVMQTLLGAAELLRQSDDEPAKLRRKVTSPGGTTEAAIRRLDEAGVRDRIVEAVKAACERSRELASM